MELWLPKLIVFLLFLDETENPDQLYEYYYLSKGCKKFIKAKTVEEYLKLIPKEIPDFTKMRNHFINAFLKDLFN